MTTAQFWMTVGASLIGVFCGAGLAFLSNFFLQRLARRRDERAAGSYAMATLIRQFDVLGNIRRGIANETSRAAKEAPELPVWLCAYPIIHGFREELAFDFSKLTFIFEMERQEVFFKLHQAENLYRSLMTLTNAFNEAAREKQVRLEEADFDLNQEVSLEAVLKAIGPELSSRLQSLLAGIGEHCLKDRPEYIAASGALHAALKERFGGKGLFRLADDA